jgi:hypothetical protein
MKKYLLGLLALVAVASVALLPSNAEANRGFGGQNFRGPSNFRHGGNFNNVRAFNNVGHHHGGFNQLRFNNFNGHHHHGNRGFLGFRSPNFFRGPSNFYYNPNFLRFRGPLGLRGGYAYTYPQQQLFVAPGYSTLNQLNTYSCNAGLAAANLAYQPTQYVQPAQTIVQQYTTPAPAQAPPAQVDPNAGAQYYTAPPQGQTTTTVYQQQPAYYSAPAYAAPQFITGPQYYVAPQFISGGYGYYGPRFINGGGCGY